MTNELQLHQISVSEMDNNCYLLQAGEEGLLVDAADDAPALLDMAQKAGVKITAVLTTHRHWDHVRALAELATDGVELLGGEADAAAPGCVSRTATDAAAATAAEIRGRRSDP